MKRWFSFVAIFIFIFFLFLLPNPTPAQSTSRGPDYDVLIINGLIYDGTLKPAFRADIAVKDGGLLELVLA
ncbi:MAG: hypothetical protein ACPLRA_03200 [Candidatus Saccharicenans sp.]